MAPVKINKDPKAGGVKLKVVTTRSQAVPSTAVSTRSQVVPSTDVNNKTWKTVSTVNEKRKADCSPLKKRTSKRSAFNDLTNAADQLKNPGKNGVAKKDVTRLKDERLAAENTRNLPQRKPINSKVGGSALDSKNPTIKCYGKLIKPAVALKSKLPAKVKVSETSKEALEKEVINITASVQRISSGSSDNSLYVTALEEIVDEVGEKIDSTDSAVETLPVSKWPEDVLDFDAETWSDPVQVSNYAVDIFNYLKEREAVFRVDCYMERQSHLNKSMRALLVDWMVEVQESFELNHETLYLAVKLVDLYLSKITVLKETLQLIGAATILIACKYDERMPPLVDDFLYICDGAYTQAELIKMEMNIIKAMDFNLGIPLSYRFLRRYGRCAKVSMPTLTLARYILEFSLMEYSFITTSDSKLAAAALLLALKMKNLSSWTPTLKYYSGYNVEDIKDIVHSLNAMLHKKPKEALATIRNKYSHRVFYEVAKLPLLDNITL